MNKIFNLLSEKERNLLSTRSFINDQVIFWEGDECNSVGIVIKGNIQIVSYSFSGKEIIYNSLSAGDMFGNNLIFSDDSKYKGNVKSLDNSEIAFIQKSVLLELLQNNTKFLEEYLAIQSNFAKSLNNKIKLLSFSGVYDRFFFYLYSHNNKIYYKNVTSLSKIIGVERESLSRLLSKLESEEKIIRDKHTIKLI